MLTGVLTGMHLLFLNKFLLIFFNSFYSSFVLVNCISLCDYCRIQFCIFFILYLWVPFETSFSIFNDLICVLANKPNVRISWHDNHTNHFLYYCCVQFKLWKLTTSCMKEHPIYVTIPKSFVFIPPKYGV